MSRRVVTLTMNPAVDVSTSVGRLEPTHKLRCSPERRDAGGGGINVARVVHRLGGETVAVYPAGGPIGDLLDELVGAEGVACRSIPITGHTREDMAVTETATGSEYRFVLPGPTLSQPEVGLCRDMVAAQIRHRGFVVASGSLPPGLSDDFYKQIAAMSASRGAKFVLDTSGPALKAALGGDVELIKPSLRELGTLVGAELKGREAWIGASSRLVAQGATKFVALTLGAQGAILVGGGVVLDAPAPRVAAVGSVGAGDSFLGAMIWSLAQERGLEELLRIAVAAGSAALLTPGTALCQPADISKFAAQIEVRASRAALAVAAAAGA